MGIHVFFLPFMAHGHMIPMIDSAKVFAARGTKTTIITTPLNASLFSKTIERTKSLGFDIDIQILKFPCVEAGLPDGCENFDSVLTKEMSEQFFAATSLLQEPLERLMQKHKPQCLVADAFFPWATKLAAKFKIPRIMFYGTSFFSTCVIEILWKYEPHKKVSSDSEPFVVPDFPGEIEFTREQVPIYIRLEIDDDLTRFFRAARESSAMSYGVIVNSFYELEPSYVDYYKNVLGKKAWHIGPVSLCNVDMEDKAWRGKQSSIDKHECLKWLDSKEPNSVIYICFGSVASFTPSQLMEIASGLEASGQQFIWVIKRGKHGEEKDDCLVKGFEKRIEGKGLIIRGWAPQVLILEHEAIGGFVSHCGWNSILEAVSTGVPMITWPVAAEQFINEKLVAQVLKVGISLGIKTSIDYVGEFVSRDAIEKAVRRLVVGEEAEEFRNRARAFQEMARLAIQEGGSSYNDLSALIEEIGLQGNASQSN